jgi:secreted trypsin-like serine protease
MFKVLLFSLALIGLVVSQRNVTSHQRVIGGKPVELGDYGYLVYIVADSDSPHSFACGGGILNRRYVITAGHCIASTLFVIYGRLDVNGYRVSDTVQVQRWYRHPKFSEKTKAYDIALLELAQDIPENYPYVHYLTVATNFPPYNFPLQIAGWGLYEGNQGTSTPRYGTVHIGPDSNCKFAEYSTFYWFCASDKDTLSCPGDSGSPLVVRNGDRWAVVGLDSITESTDCAGARSPTAETKVANMIDFLVANSPLEPITYYALDYNSVTGTASIQLPSSKSATSDSAILHFCGFVALIAATAVLALV